MNEIIRSIESAQLKDNIPEFRVGDTVRVQVKVVEGSRERLQAFEGVVIARRNGSVRETFTVRRTSYGGSAPPSGCPDRRARSWNIPAGCTPVSFPSAPASCPCPPANRGSCDTCAPLLSPFNQQLPCFQYT